MSILESATDHLSSGAVVRNYRRVAAALACGLFILLSLAAVREQNRPATWGLSAAPDPGGEPRITWVQPSGLAWDQGVRVGDRVVAIANQSITIPTTKDLFANIDHLSPLILIDRERGNTYKLQTTGVDPDPGMTLALWLVGAVFLGTGSLVLVGDSRTEEASAFFGLCFTAGVMFALALPYYSGELWIILSRFVFTNLAFGFFAYFFLVFPEKQVIAIRRRQVPPITVFVVPLLFTTYYATTIWSPNLYGPGRALASLSQILLTLVGVAALVLNYTRSSQTGTRYQLRLIAAGTIIAVLPLLVLNMLPGALGLEYLLPPMVTIIPTVLIPLSFAYAILRYRLRKTTKLVRNGFIHLGNWTILAVSFVLLAVIASRSMLGTLVPWQRALIQGVILIAIAIVLPKLQVIIKAFVDRAFFQDVQDHERTLQTLSTELSVIRNAGALVEHAVKRLTETMNLTHVLMLLRQPNGDLDVVARTPDCDEQTQSEIRALATPHLLREIDDPLRLRTGSGRDVFCVPLKTGKLSTGFLCLGPKANGDQLHPQDRSLLQSVAAQVSLGLDNVRLLNMVQENLRRLRASSEELAESRQQLQELNRRLLRAQEEERGKVAADLHDEPLQAILLLQRQMGNCPHIPESASCPCRPTAEEAAKVLRHVCANLRPSLLDDLGLAPALEWLVAEANKVNGTAALFVNQDQAEERLPNEVEAALFRVAQEAISNCLRHARASRLTVRLWRDQNLLFLSVADDGRGYQVPTQNSMLMAAGHMGIIGMRERMSLVGGQLDILSAPGQGTEVLARLEVGKRSDQSIELSGGQRSGVGDQVQ